MGGTTDTRTCAAHKTHSPRPQEYAVHHVLPKGWGGAEDGATVILCPTGHVNVHELLDEYRTLGQTPPWTTRRQYGPGERAVAAAGWDLYRAMKG